MNEVGVIACHALTAACSICCLLGSLRNAYWEQKWKLAVICAALAGTGGILERNAIGMELWLNLVIVGILAVLLYSIKAMDALFDSIAAVSLYGALQIVLLLFLRLLGQERMLDPALFFLALLLLAALPKAAETVRRIYEENRNEVLWILLNLLYLRILYQYGWNQDDIQSSTQALFFKVIVFVILATNIALIMATTRAKEQNEELRKHLEMDQAKEKLMDRLASRQHEFAKHLQVIRGLAEKRNLQDSEQILEIIREYLSGLQDREDEEKTGAYVGNGAVSALILEAEKSAKKRSVQFGSLVEEPFPEFPCKPYELVEIIGNLIQNAFDAVELLEENRRKIFLKIGEKDQRSFIEVMNAIDIGIGLTGETMMVKGFSSKEGERRGYGLSNVKSIAERYGGRLEIGIGDQVILVKVLF